MTEFNSFVKNGKIVHVVDCSDEEGKYPIVAGVKVSKFQTKGRVRKMFVHGCAEKDVEYPLGTEKEPVNVRQMYFDMIESQNDTIILSVRRNKKLLVEGLQKHISDMQEQIRFLESDVEIDSETKKKKIAKRQEIIKNCQGIIDSQIAYMQKNNRQR